MNSWKIRFWLPGNVPSEKNVFGCSTYGYATETEWYNPDEKAAYTWDFSPKGEVLSGTYADVLESLKKIDFVPKVAITVFVARTGMEDFLTACKDIIGNVPIVGGGAAIGSGQTAGEILPGGKDVSMLLIAEGKFKTSFYNIHEEKMINLEIEPASERIIRRVKHLPSGDWVDAAEFYREQQKSKKLAPSDFETVTLSDLNNRNVHCSIVNNELRVNANLPKNNRMILRTVSREEATERFSKFISEENSLIFGCAGLRSLYNRKLFTGKNTFAGFFFGETLTIGGNPCFGNLLLSRLTYIK